MHRNRLKIRRALTMTENEFSAAAGKAVDDALAAIETISKAGDSFRAAVEERFGAEVARREATWFITEVHRPLNSGRSPPTSGGPERSPRAPALDRVSDHQQGQSLRARPPGPGDPPALRVSSSRMSKRERRSMERLRALAGTGPAHGSPVTASWRGPRRLLEGLVNHAAGGACSSM